MHRWIWIGGSVWCLYLLPSTIPEFLLLLSRPWIWFYFLSEMLPSRSNGKLVRWPLEFEIVVIATWTPGWGEGWSGARCELLSAKFGGEPRWCKVPCKCWVAWQARKLGGLRTNGYLPFKEKKKKKPPTPWMLFLCLSLYVVGLDQGGRLLRLKGTMGRLALSFVVSGP